MLLLNKNIALKKKLYQCYKHIRYKSKLASPKEAVNLQIARLAEILDCTPYTAKKIISHNDKILSLPSDSFIRNLEFCKKHLKLSDIVEYPIIVTLNSSLLQHRYFSLKELGCCNVTAYSILRFSQILKQTPDSLQREGITFDVSMFLDTLLNMLDIKNKDEVESQLLKMYKDGSSLWDIKAAMNAEFLGVKLQCSLFKAQHLFKRYPPLRIQSIMNTNELLDVLFKVFRFSNSKVFMAPSLLSLHHEIAQNFLSDMPTILGVDTVELVNKMPVILRRPTLYVQRIENILMDFKITDSQLMSCPRIISFSPSVLKQRLESLCNSEDFALLKCYKKFLWLVYHYNNINPRLLSLKQYDVPCSISMFTVSKSNFDRYLFVNKCRTHIKDICIYLADVFSCSEREIQQKLKEYPNVVNSSLINCNRVINFLLDAGVSKQQLLNGIGVIFYDIDVVKMYFQEIQSQSDCQPFSDWIDHYNLIQLLIYKIEVDAGFRGTCFYRVRGRSDDFDEGMESASGQSC